MIDNDGTIERRFMTKTPCGLIRQATGFSAFAFAKLLRSAGCNRITENRLLKIESGRLKADETERDAIARLLDTPAWKMHL